MSKVNKINKTSKKISVSMMCADFLNLEKELRAFEANHIEYLHIDIMDGSFVPNYTLGTDFCRRLKEASPTALDLHLMITDPERKLEWFAFGEGDFVSVHYESTAHVQRTLKKIKDMGGKPMIALNPATPVMMIENILDDIDAVLLMTVNPGYAGQALIPAAVDKIKKLREYLDNSGYGHIEIEVDGNVSFENAKIMSEAGADIFVAGSSSVFIPGSDISDISSNIRELRLNIQ
jgi:ribulose-phosphate 3-epimerase